MDGMPGDLGLGRISHFSLVTLASLAGPAFGQVVLSPVAVSTAIPSFNGTVSPTNLINQSGIETPFVSGVTDFNTYFAVPHQVFGNSGDGGVNNWQSDTAFQPGYQGFLDFDLGASYQLNKLAIWNRSLSNITVKVLADLSGPEQVAGSFSFFDRQSFPFSYAVDVLDFNAALTGRYVRLEINGIYFFQGFTFGNASAGEVVVSARPSSGSPPPALSIAPLSNGDVQVTFSGTLQTSPSISGTFTNVPGNPGSPLTLPRAGLLPRQYFRAREN